MIFSPSRKKDMEARVLMLECMEIGLRNGQDVRVIGESSKILGDRIRVHSYEKEDAFEARLRGIMDV